ncbi:prolyl oligopeptidase family serine peptidase [Ancylobacter sp. WKF20]|uniref:alpha/beta hydrolase family protein n=1 Tax=Ancylobacter sp. WKF20 TaxID=3039801 RepID=UPI0024342129|nr:prolyl oligopeptidase family serine peptidase [Ancylobacter sp. WKF20]WGD32111.1 prolyl oligopeptidase family serine peptidase [Ancylobacter sp. WKF20]
MGWISRALLGLALTLAGGSLTARADGASAVPSGVSYELIGRWDADKLNAILTTEAPRFFGVTVAYAPARNAVRLYRVTYPSVVPEQGNRPIITTGLLALPDTDGTSFPLLSYQHGTVYGKKQVPSFPDQSPETELALALFAGQGYAVIGADYFGMGASAEPEGYLVKASHQQATYDMLLASRAVLAQMNITTTKLFLGGWSQGGFVTMAMLQKLEEAGIAVDGAATASAPFDGYAALSGFLDFPRPNDATWVTTLFILTAFSFENYYGVPGLARSLINDSYYDVARAAYERKPYDPSHIPTAVKDLVRAEYFDARFFRASAYGRILLNETQAYRWIIRSPVRNYYGEKDEVITPGLGQLAMTYQRGIGAGNMQVEAISTGPTDHRGTYATAIPLWKAWFDSK